MEVLFTRACMEAGKAQSLGATNEEQLARGLKGLQIKAMGGLRQETTKTRSELADLLYDAGVTSSPEQARDLLPSLDEFHIYAPSYGGLEFRKITDKLGFPAYKITAIE